MNEAVKNYRRTMGRIGYVLLLFLLMFYGTAFLSEWIGVILELLLPYETVYIISSILSSVFYFASFTLAAWFFHLGNREETQPLRFTPYLPKSTFLIVFAGVAITMALAIVNSIAATVVGFIEPEEIFVLPVEFSSDASIILQFIAIAIVPAICEEILFRGVILSNLMPYGKASAIMISALLFGLMHGNFYQFLYTTAAGVIMGCIYVLTESIWCSIIFHFINNSVSLLQIAILGRFSEKHSLIIIVAYEAVLLFVGIICAFALIARRSKKGRGLDLSALTFSPEISPKDSIKGLLSPTVIAFAVISVACAFMVVS